MAKKRKRPQHDRPDTVRRRPTPEEQMQVLMDMTHEPLGPGVNGLVKIFPDKIEILGLRAEVEGSGDVGRWLDQLPTDCLIRVPNVTSDRLKGMLSRRGFREVQRFEVVRYKGQVQEFMVPTWIRKPVRNATP
jgi:hypothetical protein